MPERSEARSVVVTGGAGFIGSHVVDALVARGARVRVIDDFSTGFRQFLNPAAELCEASLLDPARVRHVFEGADQVLHLAANADVRRGLDHPRKDIEQNLLATHNVLEAMREHGVTRIAFASTGAVYGDATRLPTPEDAPFPVQTSLYAASKLAAEGLLTAYAHGYGFRVHIYRFVSMLGPRYTHGHVFDFWRKLRADPTRLEVLGDGQQRKSYLHVRDCVRAILLGLERATDAVNILNIGHQDWLSVRESVSIVCRALGVSPQLSFSGGDRGWVGDSPKILLDTTRLRALGWAPSVALPDAIVETLQFLEANPYCAGRG
ncbi:MAG TPA: NAD-dependent epimerase/dehydratase family protein [Polyangiaceae bacterium]|nr:NAD-dependent epimerase/dehydratase family protein [Polyangiaceae bacterium]